MRIVPIQRFLLFLILTVLTSARAGTFIVTDASDTANATSLRGAIIAANAVGGANIVVLTNTIYSLTITGVDETGSFTGDLDVTNGNLTIIGLSSSPAIIDATGLGDRVFQVLPNAQLALDNVMDTKSKMPLHSD